MYVNYWHATDSMGQTWYGLISIDHVPYGDCSILVPGTEDWTFDDFCNYVMGS